MNVLVVGKPKSGTTVVSKVIQKSLPTGTGYALEPRDPVFFEHPAASPGMVVKVVFEAWRERTDELRDVIANRRPMTFDKRVFTLRDPRDEAISYLLYYAMGLKRRGDDPVRLQGWVEFLRRKEENPAAVSFLDMAARLDELFSVNFRSALETWRGLDEGYDRFLLNIRQDHYVVRYEDFVAGNTAGLAAYLNVSLTDDRDVGPALANTLRSARADNWKRYFTSEDVEFFRRHEAALARLGYDDWELAPVARIPSEEMSGYVERLLDG